MYDEELGIKSTPFAGRFTKVIYLNDLRNVVRGIDPSRTVFFTHEPLLTNAGEKGTDFAEYGWRETDGGIIPGEVIYDWFDQNYGLKKEDLTQENWDYLMDKYGIVMKRRNAGNVYPEDLESLLIVSAHGHFEESAGNMCDRKSKPLEEGKYYSEGRFNASALDQGLAGYVERIPGFVSFRRIRFAGVEKAESLEYEDIELADEFNQVLSQGDFSLPNGRTHKEFDRFVKMPASMRPKRKIDLNLRKPVETKYQGFELEKSGLYIRKTSLIVPDLESRPTKLIT